MGSRYESDKNNGVAHFLEHMAFKGTEKRSQKDIELEVENKGAHLNAYTSREMTVYYAKCFSQDLPWAVELLSDILNNSKFEDQLIERERDVILREMQEIESNYQEVVFDYLHSTAYQGTPLGRTILGPVENIKSLGRGDLKKFIDNFYKAPKMVLTAAGGVDHKELHDLADKHFGSVSANYTSGMVERTPCRYTGSDLRDRDDALPLGHIACAVEGPGWRSPDTTALMIASMLNGSWDRTHGGTVNAASKLIQKWHGGNVVHSFQNFFTCYHDTSLWGIYLTMEGGPDMYDAFFKVTGEWSRMCYGLTEGEVTRAKNQLKTNMLLQLDGTTPVCEEIGRHMLVYGERRSIGDTLSDIDNLTSDDVREVCYKYLFNKDPVIAALGPVEALPDYTRVQERMTFPLL